jgi:hypothetical protein
MGLDMYLTASKYIGNWDHSTKEETDCFNQIARALDIVGVACPASPSLTVDVTVAYWRKANPIHKWFVGNIQEGVDNCQKSYVSQENLEELVSTCKKVLKHKGTPDELKVVMECLPPQEGFFFGSTTIDQYYWDDIENTIFQLEGVLTNPKIKNFDFYYQASW